MHTTVLPPNVTTQLKTGEVDDNQTDTWRNTTVIITSKRRRDVVLT